jgi:phage tail-like protein
MRKQHIERLLPASFQRTASPGSVLDTLLGAMERLHEPTERTLTHIDDIAAAYRAPEQLLPYLISWVAWDHLGAAALRPGRQRELIANAAALAAARGTAAGMSRLLSTLTGIDGFVIDEPADRAFHIIVRVPAAAADQLDLIRRVVAAEKPAATTCEVLALTGTVPPEKE